MHKASALSRMILPPLHVPLKGHVGANHGFPEALSFWMLFSERPPCLLCVCVSSGHLTEGLSADQREAHR